MGGLRRRIRAAEERASAGPMPPCPACGDRIIEEEIRKDGTVTYPFGEPCEACDSYPPDGRISRIVLDWRDPKDRPPEDGREVVWPY